MKYWYFALMMGLATGSVAGTYYQLQIPNKKLPYCEYMPFDYVEKNIVKTELYNRINVTQPVQVTFSRSWWDRKPLTGLTLWDSKGIVQAKKLSDRKYQYKLPLPKQGEGYTLRGILKFPAKGGFQVCVSALTS